MHSEWATCNSAGYGGYVDYGIFDPPQALMAGNALAGPTPAQEAPPAATAAAPSLVPSQPQPAKTAAPQPDLVASNPADPSPLNSNPSTPDLAKQTLETAAPLNDPKPAKTADPEDSSVSLYWKYSQLLNRSFAYVSRLLRFHL